MAYTVDDPIEESTGSSNIANYILVIKDYYTGVDEKLGIDYVEFDLKEKGNNFFLKARQWLKKDSDGNVLPPSIYNSFIGDDDTVVPASLTREILDAIKLELGEEAYEIRKKESGGINRKFYLKAEFAFDVKKFTSKKDDEEKIYYLLMTEKQKQKDQEYRDSKGGAEDNRNPNEGLDKEDNQKVDVNDLPF